MTARAFEREVRNVIVGGLVTLLFLAGTAVVVLRNTTAWGVARSAAYLASETRAIAEKVGASPGAAGLGDEAAAVRLLRESGARGAALYDSRGARLAEARSLPGAGEAPERLAPEDLASGPPLVRGSGMGTSIGMPC